MKLRRVILALTLAALCLSCLGLGVLAAQTSVTVPLDVTIDLSGNVPSKDETYTVVLEAKDSGYPMPQGKTGGTYRMNITGENTAAFPDFHFDKVGIFEYTVYQVKGSNRSCDYDERVYDLVITVTNAENGGLEYTVALRLYDSDGEVEEKKLDQIVFQNYYHYPDTPKTDDESNLARDLFLAAGAIAILALLFLTRKPRDAA